MGGPLLALQDVPQNRVLWTHQEPYSKAQRITDSAGAFASGVEVEPFGLETNRSFDWSAANQKRKFTTYDRGANGGGEAMLRRYNRWQDRFDQPDPYSKSMNGGDPQSLNRYAYVQGDPVNFMDPTGLRWQIVQTCSGGYGGTTCHIWGAYWIPDGPGNYPLPTDQNPRGGGAGGNTDDKKEPCTTPSFEELQGHPALGLLPGPFDDDPEGFYNGIGDRNRRVLLNTVDALVEAGVDLTNARFSTFYLSDKPGHPSYGLVLTGLDKAKLGNLSLYSLDNSYRAPESIGTASLEIGFNADGTAHVDVDEHNPRSETVGHLFDLLKHKIEQKQTDPNFISKELEKRRAATITGCK